MFIKNNDKIDFAILERRALLELARLSRSTAPLARRVPTREAVSPPSAGTPTTAATGDIDMASELKSRRSTRRTLSNFLWGILHLPTVLRCAISGYFAAEYAQSHVVQLEQATDLIQVRLLAAEKSLAALIGPAAGRTTQTIPLTQQVAMIKQEVMSQQRQLARLASPVAGESQGAAAAAVPTPSLDSLYAALEDVFRGSREDIIQRLSPYADRLAAAGVGQPGKPAVDIGCGRGEWLELLRNRGVAAYGIDINTNMVERSVALGLDARHADLITHLRSLEDNSRSAVTAFHVVEHLPFETVVAFFDEAFRVLIPGGILILETPNPETMRIGASTFYNDPTHRNPLMPEPLQFIVEHRGFADVEILRLHPFTQGLLHEPTEDAQLLNRVLFGPQDYAIIAHRS